MKRETEQQQGDDPYRRRSGQLFPRRARALVHRMVLFGLARERSLEVLRELVTAAGFAPGRVIEAGPRLSIIEASPSANANGSGGES